MKRHNLRRSAGALLGLKGVVVAFGPDFNLGNTRYFLAEIQNGAPAVLGQFIVFFGGAQSAGVVLEFDQKATLGFALVDQGAAAFERQGVVAIVVGPNIDTRRFAVMRGQALGDIILR